ncbi:MAG: DNA adenine methylase [Sandaracinaceae bacterium]
MSPPAPSPVPALRRPAPFVKWVGGKGKLVAQLVPLLPPGVDAMRHVEPFAGGAALFFARRPERALLADINVPLIDTYRMVRDRVEEVIEALVEHAEHHDKGHYYRVRDRYNEARGAATPARAAMFLYLNRTCFNGLHRVNRKGEFNVPAGRYRNPRILDPERLRAASGELRGAELVQDGFEGLLRRARPGDFIYLDPPYAPTSATARFTSYASGGFGAEDQVRLRDVFVELGRRGCRCMLSNSDVPFIRELYAGFPVTTVAAPRAVNCDGRGRGLVSEVVVRNYGPGAGRRGLPLAAE